MSQLLSFFSTVHEWAWRNSLLDHRVKIRNELRHSEEFPTFSTRFWKTGQKWKWGSMMPKGVLAVLKKERVKSYVVNSWKVYIFCKKRVRFLKTQMKKYLEVSGNFPKILHFHALFSFFLHLMSRKCWQKTVKCV